MLLIDHRPPRRITTALSQPVISFDQGERVNYLDPARENRPFDLEDQVDFEVAEFNKKVYHARLHRAVADAGGTANVRRRNAVKTLLFAARDDHADILVQSCTLLDRRVRSDSQMISLRDYRSVDKRLDRIKAFKNDPRPKYVVNR